jgi:hypothetical protein
MGVDGFVHLRPDTGNVISDLLTVDVKVDSPVVGGCHDRYFSRISDWQIEVERTDPTGIDRLGK